MTMQFSDGTMGGLFSHTQSINSVISFEGKSVIGLAQYLNLLMLFSGMFKTKEQANSDSWSIRLLLFWGR